MSEVNGNNPTTGEAHPDVTDEQAAKRAKRTAAEQLRAGKRFDATLIKALDNTAKGLDGLAVAIVNCQAPVQVEIDGEMVDGPAPWQLVTDEGGKPFGSWQLYLSDRMSGHTFLHRIMRDEVITLLLESGLSIREAARAANASVGTVAGVKARAARPGGESAGTESTPASAADKLVTQVTNALTKLIDKVGELSDDDLEKLRSLTVTTGKKLAAMQKLRVQIAEAAQKPESETPAPAPAPAPKPGQRVKSAA
jgi:hypothetical protein